MNDGNCKSKFNCVRLRSSICLRTYKSIEKRRQFDSISYLYWRRIWKGNYSTRCEVLIKKNRDQNIKFCCINVCTSVEHIYEDHYISFQTFFVGALLLIVHTWNSIPLPSNLPRLQFTSCTVPTTPGRHHGSPLEWICQWPSSQPLSSPQWSHNDSFWA